jgi:hypothetical protein
LGANVDYRNFRQSLVFVGGRNVNFHRGRFFALVAMAFLDALEERKDVAILQLQPGGTLSECPNTALTWIQKPSVHEVHASPSNLIPNL